MNDLLSQNLSELGLPREVAEPHADIMTIWKTTYPVITPYLKICEPAKLYPFGGGIVQFSNGFCLRMDSEDIAGSVQEFWKMLEKWTVRYFNQGDLPGKIESGYRIDKGIHGCALALDIHVGNVQRQIEVAPIAKNQFSCVGLYPQKTCIHVDNSNEAWREQFRPGWQYWVFWANKPENIHKNLKEDYHRQETFYDMVRFANEQV